MSALRSVAVVGLLALVGCAGARGAGDTAPVAPVPTTTPATVPGLPATIDADGADPMRATRPTRVDHARTGLNAKYAAAWGFDLGFTNRAPRPAYAVALAQTCRTSDDCGGGDLSCRAREDGVRVCMGLGSQGESCWFDADCLGNRCDASAERRTCR